MNATSAELGARTLRTFERGLESREASANRSHDEISGALLHTYEIINKLKEIGQAIFDEKNDERR